MYEGVVKKKGGGKQDMKGQSIAEKKTKVIKVER